MDLPEFELQETFSLFDTKDDDCIYAKQIAEVLRVLGQNPTEADIQKLGYANRPEERISCGIFLTILQEVKNIKNTYQTEDFLDGFRHFDKDQSSTIASAQLRHLLTTSGDQLSNEEFDRLISGMEDNQGMINYEGAFTLSTINISQIWMTRPLITNILL